ncbi:alpha/beta fold hydrolase [Andreprevotia chitinilytica]|uniref:alpha/beta fold hydrolase n=1 Tax=Andreprevotia chitinilytica TaxID=396808 RepID=UPI0005576BDC|nr:alpha/beta hydrolase [Andreprevotia chitinilytica]
MTTNPTPTSALHLASIAPNRYVDSPVARFAYRKFGRPGTKPLVFLQRFRGTMDDWDPDLLDALAAERTILLFDSAGIGRSTGQTPPTIQGIAEAAASFIEALGLGSVDILGWSLGGTVAQQLALDRPDLVDKLVIAGSGPGYVADAPAVPDKVWQVAGKAVNDDEDFLYLFFNETPASRAAGVAHLARLKHRTDAFEAPVKPASIGAQVAAIQASGHPAGSLLPRLGQLKLPVLVANGINDVMIPAFKSYVMAQALPQAKLVLYPDAGHGFLFQYGQAFAREVLVFLEG